MRVWKAASLAILMLTLNQCSVQEKPSGFMGHLWGTPLEQVREKVQLLFIDQDQYLNTSTFQSDIDKWQGIKLATCIFSFYDDKLYSVSLVAEGEANREALTRKLKEQYGEGTARGATSHVWASYGSMVNLYYNGAMNATFADIMSPLYSAQIQKKITETAMKADGLEDF